MRTSYRPRADVDMATLNAKLDTLADPVPLGIIVEQYAPVQCRVRWVAIWPGFGPQPIAGPCEQRASFEALCRACGKGGPTCAQHERFISADPDVVCAWCMAQGLGADVYAFVPLV